MNGTVISARSLSRTGDAERDLRQSVADQGGGEDRAALGVGALIERLEDRVRLDGTLVGVRLKVVLDAHHVPDPAPHVRHRLLFAGGVANPELLNAEDVQREERDIERGSDVRGVERDPVAVQVPVVLGEHVGADVRVHEADADRRCDPGARAIGPHVARRSRGEDPLAGLEQAFAHQFVDPAGPEQDLRDPWIG